MNDLTSNRLLQPLKASFPIPFTVLGIAILVRLPQSVNALSPILFSPSFKVML